MTGMLPPGGWDAAGLAGVADGPGAGAEDGGTAGADPAGWGTDDPAGRPAAVPAGPRPGCPGPAWLLDSREPAACRGP